MSILIQKVDSPKLLKSFIDFEFQHYDGDSQWIPPLRSDLKNQLEKPFSFIERDLFLIFRDKTIVGRIGLIINHQEILHLQERHARFSWVEFVEDNYIFQKLMEHAINWAKDKNCSALKGPFGYTNLDTAGIQIDGFDESLAMMAIHNKPYYSSFFQTFGFSTEIDWIDVELHRFEISSKVHRVAELVKERYHLRILDLKSTQQVVNYAEEFFALINQAYSHLPGFIPISEEQKIQYKKKFLKFLDPSLLTFVVDQEEKLQGFIIAMPSIGKALKKANGRIFPFGWYHLNKALKNYDGVELYLVAVLPKWRKRGVPALLLKDFSEKLKRKRIKRVIASPQQLSNKHVNNLLQDFDMEILANRKNYILYLDK